MSVARILSGFSLETDDLVFDKEIPISRKEMKGALGIDTKEKLVGGYRIHTPQQMKFFEEKFGIKFDPACEYFIEECRR